MEKELELYEVLYLINPTFTEQELENKIEFYRDFLTKKGSQVMVKTHGKVSLAYPIKGLDIATSVQIVYLGNGSFGWVGCSLNDRRTQVESDPLWDINRG